MLRTPEIEKLYTMTTGTRMFTAYEGRQFVRVPGCATLYLFMGSRASRVMQRLARQAELMLRQVPQVEAENQQLRGDLSEMPN